MTLWHQSTENSTLRSCQIPHFWMCSLVKPVENDDSHTFSQSPSPHSPHFKLPGFFILYPINIPAPCLWEDGPETSDLVWLIQYSSATQSCLTLCDPMDCSTPGLPVHHQLLESTQTHAHWVGDTIQPAHPLSSASPPTFSLSQCQGLFKWVSSHRVAKVLEFQLQHQSFQWIFRTDLL